MSTNEAPAVHVGIDENGLGPRLGPLIVTAAIARTSPDGARRAQRPVRGRMAERLGDSKQLASFVDSSIGEAWARAIAHRVHTARISEAILAPVDLPSTPDELIAAMSLDPREVLRSPCPPAHADQCWAHAGEKFGVDVATVRAIGADLETLAARGVDIIGVRVAIVCTERLNDAMARGLSRFDVDLHTMERLALAARAQAGCAIAVTCGKVGGYNRYMPAFGPLRDRAMTVIEEGRARSAYAVEGLGTVAFVRDADDQNMLVSMASLVGKWVRDLLMRRIVGYHRADDSTLPVASGYHDPVTARFVAATALSRARRSLPDVCFERSGAKRAGRGD